ncbi:hypothetical protein [Candidatus Contubernalis alkaliaceticus]|uniref:hypothetical protein n=1 Tax=Candidatus Contubernalis alkaliaceticus TaxID=338645 RepID=UPI001F4C4910|nr:hypothetical protein [Candidatus Contubernalis alkalaceticus]UNC93144.1 hypothetical protein HUE98_14230 [Candidatus Contubernalis alkalaceticus]
MAKTLTPSNHPNKKDFLAEIGDAKYNKISSGIHPISSSSKKRDCFSQYKKSIILHGKKDKE